MFIVAASKVCRKVLLPSLLASVEGHVVLAQKLDCKAVVYTPDTISIAQSISSGVPTVKLVEAPGFEELIDDSMLAPHYPYEKTFDESEWDPVFVVHTSGTTGTPKPVVYTQGHMSDYSLWEPSQK
ncbi:hypothetical protein AAFC00_004308 [Neodothiora populina]|uniref:AMP-dependent synthetase/ligase domain-containing protein n=1 Tax=Neodothiora populina TaxID=2781224 RepID=A0ABR3PJ94_9PEZI